MRFYKVAILLLIFLLMSNFSYATYKEDLIIAIGNTYTVGKESYKLPEDIRVTAVNYLRTHYFTEEQCAEILECIHDAVNFANQIGTLDITKISGEDIDKGLSYAYKAIDIAKSAPTYEELEKLEQEKKEVVKVENKIEVEKKIETVIENKVESEVATQQVNTEDVIGKEEQVSKTYEDNIDYSKYIDENQYVDVDFEDVKSLVIKEATNYSIKKFVPYILGVILFIIAIIFVVKKIRGGKKMKNKFIVGCLSIIAVFSMGCVNATADFSDVPESHWANPSVERWVNEDVIRGYEDDTYKPENAITRAEFVTLLDRVFRLSKSADLSGFADVNVDAWYYESLAKAYNMGIIKGYSETEMGPDKLITRQEAMTIISRILLANDKSATSSYNLYIDNVQVAEWAREAISLLTDKGYANGYEDNTIRPNNNITRAETAKLLDRTFGLLITKPGTYDIDSVEGEVVVVSDDVVLEGKKFNRNIYVAPSVDLTTVKYDEKIAEQVIKLDEDKGTTVTPVVEDEKEEKTGGGGGSSSTQIYNITVSENNGVYEFTTPMKRNLTSKDILKVDGILDKSYLRTETEVEAVIGEIISKLEKEKILATAKLYKGDPTVQELGLKVLGTLSAGEHIEESAVDTMIEKTLAALDRDELIALANVVIKSNVVIK